MELAVEEEEDCHDAVDVEEEEDVKQILNKRNLVNQLDFIVSLNTFMSPQSI